MITQQQTMVTDEQVMNGYWFNIKEELELVGFKGLLLEKLLQIITDYNTMEEFWNFIILNEEKQMTKVLLVHKFLIYMQSKYSFSDAGEFKRVYCSVKERNDRQNVIAKLFFSKSDEYYKVIDWIDTGKISFEEIYKLVVDYRRIFTAKESISLIEIMLIK
ncbi:hypothetical protein [Paenibacillus aquistagni]|uniref:Uncharacterized protein n=1 Tax=Paenibacillus aquistagni TaxID=1852522 RepID=A0A1X7LEJ4_9BACL|nr:hypothetical protein [Paenibacillus aquistagni]SMG52195.1 hypothetical protein SAMN06295960_3359 [Paenibacillus aquistagni]